MCGLVSRPIAATRWSIRLISHFILRLCRLYGLIIELRQQLALWIALCMATTTILFFSVKHFVPSTVERILRGLKPLLLLLYTPRGGNKPSTEVLLFQVPFRDDVCVVVRTVFLSGERLMSFILGIAVIGQRLRTMFAVCWFILLYRWVNVVIVSSGVDWGGIVSCAVIAVFAEAGFGAAPTLSLWLLLEGAILRCILPFLVIAFFGCIHHVYVV